MTAWSHPYLEGYNIALDTINEFALFFFLTMCLVFTDFMEDLSMRGQVSTALSMFMYLVMAINVCFCVIAILFTHKKFWLSLFI